MNQRIKDIFEQACFETEYDDVQNLRETMDRFAELIVKECAGVELYWLSEQDRKAVAEKIKEHFGVKG